MEENKSVFCCIVEDVDAILLMRLLFKKIIFCLLFFLNQKSRYILKGVEDFSIILFSAVKAGNK
jgi:hypothetical protein